MKALKCLIAIISIVVLCTANTRADFTVEAGISVPILVVGHGLQNGLRLAGFTFPPGASYSFDSAMGAPPPHVVVTFELLDFDTDPVTIYQVGDKNLPPGHYALETFWTASPGAPVGLDEIPVTVGFDSTLNPVGVSVAPEPGQPMAEAFILGCGGLIIARRRWSTLVKK